jgi:hypothetical protein
MDLDILRARITISYIVRELQWDSRLQARCSYNLRAGLCDRVGSGLYLSNIIDLSASSLCVFQCCDTYRENVDASHARHDEDPLQQVVPLTNDWSALSPLTT